MKNYTKYTICLLLIVMPFIKVLAQSQSQLRTPYPIIFVHGLTGSKETWDDPDYYDIVEFLSEGNTPLTSQEIRITLDRDRSTTTLNNTIFEDVHLIPPANSDAKDLYIVNFNVRHSGEIANTCVGAPITIPIIPGSETINVIDPERYYVGDIIRIGSELMRVSATNGYNLTVDRGILGTDPGFHMSAVSHVYNLSNESNQADIAKQGYGLKLAIDLVKDMTNSDKVILLGHSMGGLACREYIRSHYNNDVAKIITIGTPHYGSGLPALSWFAPIADMDPRSSALRDLGAGDFPNIGVFLFGGNESSNFECYSEDVNCDGDELDHIQGLNENYQHLGEMSRTWIVSVWPGSSFLLGDNDGIVSKGSQYISSNDTIMTNTPYLSRFGNPSESKDIRALIRGLDEPSEEDLAYELKEKSTAKGFISYQKNMNSYDVDLYKIQISTRSELSISLSAISSTGIDNFALLKEDLSFIQSSTNITDMPMLQILDEGTYYIRVSGVATGNSYSYPYTLTTNTTIIPPNSLVASPEENLEYYDVVVNNFRDKIITLTNNSLENISVINMEITGLNADQFSITGPLSFVVPPSGSSDVIVRCSPTDIGEKNATLVITNSSTDAPVINISLHGIGVASATRRLIALPDITYNYGDVNTTQNKTKVFKLKNTGSDAISVTNLSLNGMNADNYSIISQPEIPFDIETGIEKQVTIRFAPTSVGVKTADFIIANDADNASPEHIITLYGNGKNSIYNGDYNTIVAYEYWFDTDYVSKVYTPVNPQQVSLLNSTISTEGLNTGLHRLHFRSKDNRGLWSSIVTEVFHKLPVLPAGTREITEYEYWFDDDYDSKVNEPTTPVQTYVFDGAVNTTSLTNGLHSFHTRYKDDAGQWSTVVTEVFHKLALMPQGERNIISYEYWFDNDYASKVTASVTPQQTYILNGGIEAISLPVGLHNYHLRFKDDGSQWSSVISEVFYKLHPTAAIPNLISEYRYWYDLNDNDMVSVTLPVPVNPYQLIKSINTCNLPLGDHTIHFQFKDIRQAWSSVVSDTFNVAVITNPVITAIGSPTFCPGGSVTLTSSPANFYLWSNGATTPSITVTNSGIYYVTISNGCGVNLTSDSISVVENTIPAAAGIISGDTTVYIGSANIIYTVPPVSGATSYVWSLPAGITGSGSTNSISVSIGSDAVPGAISVYAENECGNGAPSPDFHINVTFGNSLAGNLMYNNTLSTPLDLVWVYLYQNSIKTDSIQSDISGHYSFVGKASGTYAFNAFTNKPWAGVNGTDALKIQRHFAGLELISEPIRLMGADVNYSNSINGTDVLKVKRRFAGLDTMYARGNWTFAKPFLGGDTIIINGANVSQDFYGLCVGDVNGSYNPSTGKNAISKSVEILHQGIIEVGPGQEFDLPIRLSREGKVNAISLVIPYPSELFEVMVIQTPIGIPVYTTSNDIIRIAWSELQSLNLKTEDTLILLRLKATEKFTGDLSVDLSSTDESELADETGNVIPLAELLIQTIKTQNITGVNELNANLKQCNIFPNPASEQLNIEILISEPACLQLEITDMLGKTQLIRKPGKLTMGKNTFQLSTATLVNGIYTLKLNLDGENGSGSYVYKIVISKE